MGASAGAPILSAQIQKGRESNIWLNYAKILSMKGNPSVN